MIEIFLCDARQQIRKLFFHCPQSKKSEMSEEILCQTKKRVRSILERM